MKIEYTQIKFKLILSIALLGYNLNGHSQTLWGWGNNSYGQLGSSNSNGHNTPHNIDSNITWTSVSSSNSHSCIMNKAGTIELFGWNYYGQLGLGNKNNSSKPQKLKVNQKWKGISAGGDFTLAIQINGLLWAWGNNAYGQLGIGNSINADTPQLVGIDSNWVKISTGASHALGVKKNGTMWAWGVNNHGQLGLGNRNNYYSPQQIGTDSNYISVSAGLVHSIALKKDGTLWAWGFNNYGELGMGNNYSNYTTPHQIGSDTFWRSITSGDHSNFAIAKNGEIWGWGVNQYGQLGIGNNNGSYSPVQIGIDSNWKMITAGGSHTLGMKKDGTLWAWGDNGHGQLGLGNSTNHTTPQQVGIESNWLFIESGSYHSFALKAKFVSKWSGNGNITNNVNWSTGTIPLSNDSAIIIAGTLTVNQSTTLDIMTVLGGSTVKLEAPLTVRNLHLKNGTIDLNGHKLTVTGRIYQSTDSTNYYIQAGTSSAPKPRSELVIKPTTAVNSTLYFNPSANRINKLEIGNGTAAAQITLANAVKIKGGEDGGTGPGLLTVNKNAKIIIATGSSLTLESDTFNAGLSLAQPAQRSIVCQGTGKFNIERDHFGARGWRLYAHPFNADIDLQEVANDIELIGPGGTAKGFYSNTNLNASAYWYDYSKADSSASSDPAWTAFTSAKGSTISGNTNKWNKNSPLLLFNPGNRRGTDAFGSPTTATYEQGKINLSYTLDSTAVHLNDGTTQSNAATNIPSYVPTNGLVGYWPFNGNANDESGNGNNGTVNGAKLTTDRNGNSNSAYDFDGTSDRIAFNLGSINNTIPAATESTSSVWIKTSDLNGPLISMQGNNGIEYDFHIGTLADIVKKSGHYGILVRDNCCGTGNNAFASNCADDDWHMLTISRLSDGSLKFYKDAVLEFTSSSGQSDALTFNPTYMSFGANYSWIIGSQGGCGSCNSTDEQHYKGTLDDIAIWNRALSASEISTLYNASTNTSLSNKSKYFFITNPFTAPVKLSRIQGLTSSNVDPSFYYWKQRRNTVTNNFSPAEWQAERIFNGTALRDSNIAIPAFGSILVRLKNNNTTFTIPESAKQLTNFDYIIGGAKGTSKIGQMFLDASASDVGNNGLEIKLLVNDSQEADRVLVYNEPQQSSGFTTADARKYLNQDFPNIFTLSSDGKPLALDMQDIQAELDAGKPEVAIPIAVNREANKRFPTLKWEITANTTGLDAHLRNRENGSTELWSVGDIKTIVFQSTASEIRHYELVFKRNSSSTEDLTQKPNLTQRAPMELLVYPNPVDNQLQLKVINESGEILFHIYSITGVKVMEGSIKSEKTIQTTRLNAGVYVIDAGGVKVKFVKK